MSSKREELLAHIRGLVRGYDMYPDFAELEAAELSMAETAKALRAYIDERFDALEAHDG